MASGRPGISRDNKENNLNIREDKVSHLEDLKIKLSKDEVWGTTELEVRLYLGDEVISDEFVCIGK